MPPILVPSDQSTQATAVALTRKFAPNELWRHVPALKYCHQFGSAALAVAASMNSTSPTKSVRVAGTTNEVTITRVPALELQAKVLLRTPPSPRQASQRMLTPAPACAAPAASATRAARTNG